MADKKSIYIGENLAYCINALSDLIGGESMAMNAIGDRYRALIALNRPELTLEEWAAVCDDNNGIWSMSFEKRPPTLQMVETSTAEKHDANAGELNAAIANMTPLQRLAAVDVVERFWARSLDTRKPAAILQEILAASNA
jgi:hypothetical protein